MFQKFLQLFNSTLQNLTLKIFSTFLFTKTTILRIFRTTKTNIRIAIMILNKLTKLKVCMKAKNFKKIKKKTRLICFIIRIIKYRLPLIIARIFTKINIHKSILLQVITILLLAIAKQTKIKSQLKY